MMKIVLVYILYFWVLLIHGFFIGVCSFAFFGKKLSQMSKGLAILLLAIPLIFFELYWIPIVKYLNVSIFSNESLVTEYFNISSDQDIISQLRFFWYHPIFVFLGALFAYSIGTWVYKNRIIKQ